MNLKEIKFYEERRIFCIKGGELIIAPTGSPGSHASWFMSEGWLEDDPDLIEHIPRGYVDPEGNIYFYIGKDFEVNNDIFAEVSQHLPELIEKMDIPTGAILYGGARKATIGDKWVAKKEYGRIGCFLR